MSRVVVAGVAERAVVALARRLRDAGQEVVYVGPGVGPDVVVAAALQEDVDAVVLPAGGGAEEARAAVLRMLAERGAGDIAVDLDDSVGSGLDEPPED